jgi:VCBS repeat-containing protein
LNVILVSQPSHGTLTFNSSGSFSYTPATNYNGSDSFTYQASDGQTSSGTATVTILVDPPVNDAPVAVDDSYSTAEDTTLNVAAPGVLANDSDVEGDVLSPVLISGPGHGTLTLNGDGSFSYSPALDCNGSDSFTYQASDGQTNSETAGDAHRRLGERRAGGCG